MRLFSFQLVRVISMVVVINLAIHQCCASTKKWTQDVNFNNSVNWDLGSVPCSQDTVIFPEMTSVVYLQSDSVLREVVLPKNGQVILSNTMTIAFSDDRNDDPQCNGRDVTFTADKPKHWFDPDNWEATEGPVTVETEKIPCRYDNVVFPDDKMYSVALNQSISVGRINIAGRDLSSVELNNYLQSSSGKLQFSIDDDVSIQVYGHHGCPDTTGCPCGNDEQKTKNMICSMTTCLPLTCQNPVMPEGACCNKCGAVLVMEFDSERPTFNMEQFKSRIKTTYGGSVNINKRSTKRQADSTMESEIIFYISKTSSERIQMVITDKESGSSSGRRAIEMAQRIRRDILRDLESFGVTSVVMQSSSSGTGGHTGGAGGLTSGGSIAGILFTVLIVLAITGTVIFMYCRRVSFRKDEPLHADIEMTQNMPPAEYIQEITMDISAGKGFDNPIYASTPSPPQEKKTTFYSDPTKAEQPANGHQSNGHQATGSVEKRSYEHEKAAKGIESTDQRDATIVGLGFNNPNYGVAANKDESST